MKGTTNAMPKIEKYISYIFMRIFVLPAIQCKWYFFCKRINFVEQQFKFLT